MEQANRHIGTKSESSHSILRLFAIAARIGPRSPISGRQQSEEEKARSLRERHHQREEEEQQPRGPCRARKGGRMSSSCSNKRGGNLFRRFCNMFSESCPCLLELHGSYSTAQRPGELSENMLQNVTIITLFLHGEMVNIFRTCASATATWTWFS